jgi:hypothetical protein
MAAARANAGNEGSEGSAGNDAELEQARLELRRLGYLDHGLERFLLQDALRPRQPLRTLALLTAKVGVLAGGLLGASLAVALVVANGGVAASPLDLPVLFLHLFPPLSAAAAAAFLALASALLALVRFRPVRRLQAVALATALAAGLAGLALALWEARQAFAQRGVVEQGALALVAAVAAYGLVRLVYQGLLALAIRFTERRRSEAVMAWRWRRWVSGAVLTGVLIVAVPVALASREAEPPPPPLLPEAPGGRVLLLGLDGVLPDEIEYLLRRGDLPAMAELARRGGRLLRYVRRDEPPAAFWTSLATGLPPPRHGVAALDSFVPLGTRTPLVRSGFLRPYWSGVEVPLHLADYRPVLANRRSAFTVWELAARGGSPVLAVNWWATFPAPPLPGLVLAHDGYQLLRQGAAGAVSAPAAAPGLLRLARAVSSADAEEPVPPGGAAQAPGPLGSPGSAERAAAGDRPGAPWPPGQAAPGPAGDAQGSVAPKVAPAPPAPLAPLAPWAPLAGLAAALSPGDAAAVAERAVRPDEFYRRVFAGQVARPGAPPRVAALYLPALDIAASNWHGSDLAFADLVRSELLAADRLLAQAMAQPGWGSVAVVLDPGRRRRAASPAGGRVLLWESGGCADEPRLTTPEAVAAGLLRTLGLPQSAELPPPPAQCTWRPAPAAVSTYGRPQPLRLPGAPAAESAEYLQNLRSLGYL